MKFGHLAARLQVQSAVFVEPLPADELVPYRDLPKLWAEANVDEQRRLLMTILDAVYVDAKKTRSVIAVKPKPPFRPVFQVAAQREGSVIHILNGSERLSQSPSVFVVEAGESRPLPETILCFV